MSLPLELRKDIIILTVRAQPGARRNGIVGTLGGTLKVAVTQTAEKGKANQAILDVLCEQFQLRRSQLELLGGATSRQKRIAIRGIGVDDLRQRINDAIAQDR